MSNLLSYAKSSPKKAVPRVFVALTKLTDALCDAIRTSGTISTTGWKQLSTLGGAQVKLLQETSDLETDQSGIVDVVRDKMPIEVEMTLSAVGLMELFNVMKSDPTQTTPTNPEHMSLRENRGLSLKTYGVSFLIYDKANDTSNETDVPDVDADAETVVIYNAIHTGEKDIAWKTGEQNTATITFRALANSGSGSAAGTMGEVGAFTAV